MGTGRGTKSIINEPQSHFTWWKDQLEIERKLLLYPLVTAGVVGILAIGVHSLLTRFASNSIKVDKAIAFGLSQYHKVEFSFNVNLRHVPFIRR